jgi:hypothetical protein
MKKIKNDNLSFCSEDLLERNRVDFPDGSPPEQLQ